MRINISNIDFAGGGGTGGVSSKEFAELSGYTTSDLNGASEAFNASISTDIEYTNQLFNEWNPENDSTLALYENSNIKYAPAIDTSNVTNMKLMFRNCQNLIYVPEYNTINVNIMESMFTGCNALASIKLNNWDISNVASMSTMFNGCASLTTLDLSNWDTSNVTNMYGMFGNCSGLTSLDLSDCNMANVITINFIFNGCNQLTTLNMDGAVLPNLNLTLLKLDSCPLNVESLLGVLNALPVTTDGYTLTLGETNLNKLTDEQKAIAINKGWTLD